MATDLGLRKDAEAKKSTKFFLCSQPEDKGLFRRGTRPAQGHTAGKWQAVGSDPKPMLKVQG